MNAVSQHAFVPTHVVGNFNQHSHVQCSRPRVSDISQSVHLKPFLTFHHVFHIQFLSLEAPDVSLLNLYR